TQTHQHASNAPVLALAARHRPDERSQSDHSLESILPTPHPVDLRQECGSPAPFLSCAEGYRPQLNTDVLFSPQVVRLKGWLTVPSEYGRWMVENPLTQPTDGELELALLLIRDSAAKDILC